MGTDNCETKNERSRKKLLRDQETRSRLECLPSEIINYILSKLPLSSLVRFKCVCRAWRTLAHDPHLLDSCDHQCLVFRSDYNYKNQLSFVDFQSSYTNVETAVKKINLPFCCPAAPEVDAISSCNGLLCLSGPLNNGLYIGNPITGRYIELPHNNQGPNQDHIVYGFGFHPRTKAYKAVKIIYYRPEIQTTNGFFSMKSDVQIFTLGGSSWRSLGETSHLIHHRPGTNANVNGRLHWESRPCRYRPFRDIISFDLEDEKFRAVPKPESLKLGVWDYLVVLRNRLAVVSHKSHKEVEIWIMKEYDVKESWVKEFEIGSYVPKALEYQVRRDFGSLRNSKITAYSRESYERVLCVLRSGEILVEYRSRVLVLYDPETGNFKDLMFKGIPGKFQTVVHLGNINQIDTLISM